MTYAIDVSGLRKSFHGQAAVLDVALQVKTGEIFGFLGPNGSGKTTTIRMLCGLLTPDSGQGECLGYDIIKNSAAIKQQVGYMTQRFSYYEDLSIYENLDFIARVYNLPERRQRVRDCIAQLGLEHRQKQLAGDLSGGWKQRLALAAALLHQPKLLLLDEPTAGVDPQARRDFWNQIHELAASGITILVSTHYMDEAERCHRLAYLAYGQLLTQGTPQAIIEQSGLTTWSVQGPDLSPLAVKLTQTIDFAQVVAFGSNLHISSTDAAALAEKIAAYQIPPYQWQGITPNLEDVFIQLMREAKDVRFQQ